MAQKNQDSDSLSWMLRCTIYFIVLFHSGYATCGAPSGMLWNLLRDLFCFAVLSGNAAKNLTCFKSAGRTYELEAQLFSLLLVSTLKTYV